MIVHEMRDNPEKIWLEPRCSPERCWCEDPLDDCDEDSCGEKAIGYVREDIVEHAAREAKRLAEDNQRLRAALKEIAKPTYGTEFGMSDEDKADILGRHLFAKQDLARAALSGDKQ